MNSESGSVGAEPLEMYLCEASAVVLKPQTYRFVVDPNCDECKRIEIDGKIPEPSQAGDSTLRKSCGNCATVRDEGQFCPKCGSSVFHWVEGDSTPPADPVEGESLAWQDIMTEYTREGRSDQWLLEQARRRRYQLTHPPVEPEDNDPVEI